MRRVLRILSRLAVGLSLLLWGAHAVVRLVPDEDLYINATAGHSWMM